MTDEALTRERNILLGGSLGLVVATVVLGLSMVPFARDSGVVWVAISGIVVASKGVFVYLVFRLSRFLRHPVWLTALYCVLAPLSLLFLVPFIGLLVGVRNARRALAASAGVATSAAPGAPELLAQPIQANEPGACTACGAPLRPDHQFCHSCGQATDR